MMDQSVFIPLQSILARGGNSGVAEKANFPVPQPDQMGDRFAGCLPVIGDHIVCAQIFEIVADQNKGDLAPLKVRDVLMAYDMIPRRQDYHMSPNLGLPMLTENLLFPFKPGEDITCRAPRVGNGCIPKI